MNNTILGISAFYHDSAAALLVDGKIIAAAHEERFTRKKHDPAFPSQAIRYVLKEAGLAVSDVDTIAFYDKPILKFERLMETYHAFAPVGLRSFLSAMPVWIKEKLFMRKMIWDSLKDLNGGPISKRPELLFPEHHLSHAASAFFPSPFQNAATLTIDGVGEWATTTIGKGEGNALSIIKELPFPHSIGLLYSAFTYYCGFRVNSGEYKLMGLAPYGNPDSHNVKRYKERILERLVDLREDGSILLNMKYFDFATGLRMCKDKKWDKLFDLPRRERESELTQSYMDLALAIQQITEDMVFLLAKTARQITGSENLVMAGGVALNCVANGKLVRSGIFKNVWIQPAAGDAGGALGAAYAAHYIGNGAERKNVETRDDMAGSYIGPKFSNEDVTRLCRKYKASSTYFDDFSELANTTAQLLSNGKIIGWHQGRMEWGPRALGARSILGDPREPEMQKKLNLKIKYREGFRPFAPSVMAEYASDFFEMEGASPYMLLVAPLHEKWRKPIPKNYNTMEMFERLYHSRSAMPAITHVDYSARIQTVHKDTNPRYWELIDAFRKITNIPMLVNTSFNVRGEPIVRAPVDSYRCFMRTEMDYLVVENHLFKKEDQPDFVDSSDWQTEFELD